MINFNFCCLEVEQVRRKEGESTKLQNKNKIIIVCLLKAAGACAGYPVAKYTGPPRDHFFKLDLVSP